VEAMNALERGEVELPPDGALGELMDATELPLRPAPKPQRLAEQDIIDEQRKQDAIDRDEMRVVLAAKRQSVAASAVYSNDTAANARDAARRHKLQALDQAERQLGEMKNG
jgi:hypothetical protein